MDGDGYAVSVVVAREYVCPLNIRERKEPLDLEKVNVANPTVRLAQI